jgi:DNA-binding NarL/FixJ family response regulator
MAISGTAAVTQAPVSEPVTVLLVEDSAIVRGRLVSLIAERAPEVVLIGEAGDGNQAVSLFRQHRPRAVVLDLQLPDVSGLALLALFMKEHPTSVIIVLTNHSTVEYRRRCSELGADHFFDKSTEFERVPQVLATVAG